MTDDQFWELIDGASTPEELHQALSKLDNDALIAFERRHDHFSDQAYDWNLWGAAFVINGGCGDDSFDYFRAFLISRGREVYEAAIADADSLADVNLGDDDEDWEDWMSPSMAVVRARTGEYDFAGPPDPDRQPPATPEGDDWEEEELAARFPRLAAKHDW